MLHGAGAALSKSGYSFAILRRISVATTMISDAIALRGPNVLGRRIAECCARAVFDPAQPLSPGTEQDIERIVKVGPPPLAT